MRRGSLLALGLIGIAFNWWVENWQTVLLMALSLVAILIAAIFVWDAVERRKHRREIAADRARLAARLASIEQFAADLPPILNLGQDERSRPHAPDGCEVRIGLLDPGSPLLSKTGYYYVRHDGAWVLCQPRWARRS